VDNKSKSLQTFWNFLDSLDFKLDLCFKFILILLFESRREKLNIFLIFFSDSLVVAALSSLKNDISEYYCCQIAGATAAELAPYWGKLALEWSSDF
jgi:hypothetical protein